MEHRILKYTQKIFLIVKSVEIILIAKEFYATIAGAYPIIKNFLIHMDSIVKIVGKASVGIVQVITGNILS